MELPKIRVSQLRLDTPASHHCLKNGLTISLSRETQDNITVIAISRLCTYIMANHSYCTAMNSTYAHQIWWLYLKYSLKHMIASGLQQQWMKVLLTPDGSNDGHCCIHLINNLQLVKQGCVHGGDKI